MAFDFAVEEDGAAAARDLRLGEEAGHFSRQSGIRMERVARWRKDVVISVDY